MRGLTAYTAMPAFLTCGGASDCLSNLGRESAARYILFVGYPEVCREITLWLKSVLPGRRAFTGRLRTGI
jgi:hypothetical protein